jgi:lycopene cyclase domain-containing protein
VIPEYTIAGAVATAAVVAAELSWLHTGIFGRRRYWITMAICLFFMVLTNGWLTKLSAPIVIYRPEMKTPWRIPWDIPVEDYLFGFALLTLAIILWDLPGSKRAGQSTDKFVSPSRRRSMFRGESSS